MRAGEEFAGLMVFLELELVDALAGLAEAELELRDLLIEPVVLEVGMGGDGGGD